MMNKSEIFKIERLFYEEFKIEMRDEVKID